MFFPRPGGAAYFAKPGLHGQAGRHRVKNRTTRTLKAMARHGADAFYSGDIAADIAAAVQGDPAIAGDMTVADLANYEVIERAPVCFDYRGHNVCGMGPPSSGAHWRWGRFLAFWRTST
ncbi:MAG: gamma-glutamyltransferase [Rhodocyclaceae bacterium]